MEQERSVTQFQQDKPPACVPCSPKRAQCPAWLCHPNATLAFSSRKVSSHCPSLCAFPGCGAGPSWLRRTLGTPGTARCQGHRARGSVAAKGQRGQAEPRGHGRARGLRALWVPGPRPAPAAVRALTIPRARSAVPIKKKGRDEDCCY